MSSDPIPPKKKLQPPPQMPLKASTKSLTPKIDINTLVTTADINKRKSTLTIARFMSGYTPAIIQQIEALIHQDKLAERLTSRYPHIHDIRTDKALYDYTMVIKNQFMRQSDPIAKIIYDEKISLSHQALGLHSFVNRVQGNKVKAKNEIRISSRLKKIPEPLLKMVIIHELAHLREKDHNKAFYQLCEFMEPEYHQLEFDLRLLLLCEELGTSPYS